MYYPAGKIINLQCRRPWFDSWIGKIPWRRDRLPTPVFLGLPVGSDGKESACNAGDLGWEDPLEEVMAIQSSILVWRIPMERGAWQAIVHGGDNELDTTEWLSTTHTYVLSHLTKCHGKRVISGLGKQTYLQRQILSVLFTSPEFWLVVLSFICSRSSYGYLSSRNHIQKQRYNEEKEIFLYLSFWQVRNLSGIA